MQEWGGPAEFSNAHAVMGVLGREPFGRAPRELRRARLAEILKDEIIPRLAAARRKAAAVDVPKPRLSADPATLTRLLIAGRLSDARAEIEARLAAGATPQMVMLEDFALAARRFQELWESDRCDFFDVTVGLGALRNLAKDVAVDDARPLPAGAPAILILLAPGETHELGADIVQSFFRLAGWRAVRGDSRNFLRALARDSFDVAGFSLSCDRFADSLRAAIRAARSASRNPALTILVGGPIFAGRPGLAESLGADVCANDANAAVQLPDALLEALRL
jgi:methanogenic corrinoid protein MtbC1